MIAERVVIEGSAHVSIPFKRESISKVKRRNKQWIFWKEFQFPSNGKAYPKFYRSTNRQFYGNRWFQFPSNGKAYPKIRNWNEVNPRRKKFQFPSNGKPYPKRKLFQHQSWRSRHVSIPFKRESISKVRCSGRHSKWYAIRFNSLQTGKHIQSRAGQLAKSKDWRMRFNSLQTGKHIQRGLKNMKRKSAKTKVSIPFKRESISKGIRGWGWGLLLRFNSLQTGKHIQSIFLKN